MKRGFGWYQRTPGIGDSLWTMISSAGALWMSWLVSKSSSWLLPCSAKDGCIEAINVSMQV